MSDLKSTLDKNHDFRPPENWDWGHKFLSGLQVRYGLPRSRRPYDAVCVIIGGLGDFAEQYFELAHDFERRNIRPVIIDLPGQGGSGRYLKNPHKRHTTNFGEILEDIHILIEDVVLSAAIDFDDNHKRLPIIMLAHSMGAHFALRYLAEYNQTSRGQTIVTAASLTAPMFKIRALELMHPFITSLKLKFLSLFPNSYVPGGSNWVKKECPVSDVSSRGYARANIKNYWLSNPGTEHLAVGSPTNKWLLEAVKSCNLLESPDYVERVKIPILLALAGQDNIVSNQAIRGLSGRLPMADLLSLPGCEHEILMERDEHRSVFLNHFFSFLDKNVFSKQDKGKVFIT